MNRKHASAVVLGTSAALAAAFLVRPAPSYATGTRTPESVDIDAANSSRIRTALAEMVQTVQKRTTPNARRSSGRYTRPVAVALCQSCRPSQALVRVLLRRQARGVTCPPVILFTDQTWPALDTLARLTQSTVSIVPKLNTRIGITPVALEHDSSHLVVGLTNVAALLARPSTTVSGNRP